MKRKTIILISMMILLSFTGISAATINNCSMNLNKSCIDNLTDVDDVFTVTSQASLSLDRIIDEIRSDEDLKGYDNDTVKWMESLDDKKAFIANDSILIMNEHDAKILNDEYVTDVYIEEYIDCDIVENHSLSTDRIKDVLLVENVTYLGNCTHYYDV